MSFLQQAKRFSRLLQDQFGDSLVSVVLFGSVARSEEREDSDIDLLVILKGLPEGRYGRGIVLEPVFEKALNEGLADRFNCHLKTPEEAVRVTPFYLDFPSDARLLFDRDGFFAGVLELIARRIRESGAVRKKIGKYHYWDMKPGTRFDETVELL